jgi:hypothetical protein
MLETYIAGTYWNARREDVDACARRTELFFALLARCDPSLGQWHRGGRAPRGSPGHRVRVNDPEELRELLLQGRNRGDLTKSVIEDLGFGLHVWNQEPDDQATRLMLRCGVYSPFSKNVCLLTPPSEGEAAERMLSAPVMAQVLTCMATAWDPDWGVATTHEFREALSKNGDVRMGWMMYFARRWGTVPPLPAPVRMEPVGSLGTLVILSPERLTASDPEHVALGRRVRELLDRAGLMRPAAAR